MRRIHVGEAGAEPDGVAPDGIPIHLVLCDFHTAGQEAAMGSMRFVGLAEGRIPPGAVVGRVYLPAAQVHRGGALVKAGVVQAYPPPVPTEAPAYP